MSVDQPFPSEQLGSESDWVARIQAGDEAAFEALYHTYHAPLCGFAYRYVGTRDLAEEIVQEIFLCVWERRETWEVRTSAKNYLFTAVRNAAVSYLRHEAVVRSREAETLELFARPSPSPDGAIGSADLVAAVQCAVRRLPERCRLIFTMHREQGLTYSEIAQVLQISPKTVETQMGRALKTLRKTLAAFRS